MARYSHDETLVLSLVRSMGALTMDQVVAHLPQLSWNQIFQTVDSLSRAGAILLRRRGFDYELRPPDRSSAS